MTIATLHTDTPHLDRSPGSGWWDHLRRLRRRAAETLAHLTAALWAGPRRTAVACSRLIGWFADEPYRIRVAAAGVTACALTGLTIGVAVGYALAQLADLLLGIVRDLPGRV